MGLVPGWLQDAAKSSNSMKQRFMLQYRAYARRGLRTKVQRAQQQAGRGFQRTGNN
jgi:hypothetical protein